MSQMSVVRFVVVCVWMCVCAYVCLCCLSIADICNGPICLTFIGEPSMLPSGWHFAACTTATASRRQQQQSQQQQQQQLQHQHHQPQTATGNNQQQAGKSNSVHQLIALVANRLADANIVGNELTTLLCSIFSINRYFSHLCLWTATALADWLPTIGKCCCCCHVCN